MYEGIKERLPGPRSMQAALAGGATGAVSVFITMPIDIVKTRVQAQAVGQSCATASTPSAVIRSTVSEIGIMGLLSRGIVPRLIKISVGQAVIFAVYDAVHTRL